VARHDHEAASAPAHEVRGAGQDAEERRRDDRHGLQVDDDSRAPVSGQRVQHVLDGAGVGVAANPDDVARRPELGDIDRGVERRFDAAIEARAL